jgi:hypothetical protein
VAEHTIFLYTLKTNRGGGFDANDNVVVVWDDVAEEIKAYLTGGFTDPSPPTLLTTGPTLGIDGVDYNLLNTFFRFCDGSTLNTFSSNSSVFPYAERYQQANSIACQVIVVCDLQINDAPVLTPASNAGSNDGTALITATSSNGTIKVALFDFDYATEGTALVGGQHTFSNLYGGQYTVWAKDAKGCVDTITIVIPLSEEYGLRFVSEWTDIHGKGTQGFDHKIEIYKRGYSGSVTELKAAEDPISFDENSEGEDKMYVIRAMSLKFRIASESDGDTHELFTEDEREYRLEHSLDSGSGYVVDFIGYNIPFLYREQYLKSPKYVEIEATDGLANLKDLDFVDESGNNFKRIITHLEIISTVLKKLDLNINIKAAINMYDVSMDSTDSDDPLEQTYIDTTVYYDKDGTPEKCDVVIRNILQEYGAYITQADGEWLIARIEENIAEFDYREFNPGGSYNSNASLDPILNLDVPIQTERVAWINKTQGLGMLAAYGKFIVRQKLIPNVSLLPSYSFEAEDLVPFGVGDVFFAGWNIGINTGSGVTWGLEVVNRSDDNKGALYIKFSDTVYNEVELYTTQSKMDWTLNDTILFAFDYLVDNDFRREWVRIKFKLKIGSRYYNSVNLFESLWTETDVGYNEIYVTSYNAFTSFQKIYRTGLNVASGDNESIELRFRLDNHESPDYTSLSNLKNNEDTETAYAGVKRVAQDGSVFRFYNLRYGTDSESSPNILRPHDFDITSNPKVWELTSTQNSLEPISGFLFDKMIIRLLPFGEETPTEKEYTVVVNPNNKRTYEIDIFHGDCPTGLTNAKYAYKNYIKGSDGLPLQQWCRDGMTEEDLIQSILLKTLIAQFKKASRRLNGQLMGDVYLKPYTVLSVLDDSGRKYLVQGYQQSARLNAYNVDLYELKDAYGEDTVSSFSSAFKRSEFGTGFDI